MSEKKSYFDSVCETLEENGVRPDLVLRHYQDGWWLFEDVKGLVDELDPDGSNMCPHPTIQNHYYFYERPVR